MRGMTSSASFWLRHYYREEWNQLKYSIMQCQNVKKPTCPQSLDKNWCEMSQPHIFCDEIGSGLVMWTTGKKRKARIEAYRTEKAIN